MPSFNCPECRNVIDCPSNFSYIMCNACRQTVQSPHFELPPPPESLDHHADFDLQDDPVSAQIFRAMFLAGGVIVAFLFSVFLSAPAFLGNKTAGNVAAIFIVVPTILIYRSMSPISKSASQQDKMEM